MSEYFLPKREEKPSPTGFFSFDEKQEISFLELRETVKNEKEENFSVFQFKRDLDFFFHSAMENVQLEFYDTEEVKSLTGFSLVVKFRWNDDRKPRTGKSKIDLFD